MAKNKITDLRDHLFAQLERLSDDQDMKNPIKRDAEIARANAISNISKSIVETAKLEVDYMRAISAVGKNGMDVSFVLPDKDVKQLENKTDEKTT